LGQIKVVAQKRGGGTDEEGGIAKLKPSPLAGVEAFSFSGMAFCELYEIIRYSNTIHATEHMRKNVVHRHFNTREVNHYGCKEG
jgi:hypothetical protein